MKKKLTKEERTKIIKELAKSPNDTDIIILKKLLADIKKKLKN